MCVKCAVLRLYPRIWVVDNCSPCSQIDNRHDTSNQHTKNDH
jgi:hypothetical protein